MYRMQSIQIFSKFFVVSIIMLVSGYTTITLLPNYTMLYYVFSGPLSLRAYTEKINKYKSVSAIVHKLLD